MFTLVSFGKWSGVEVDLELKDLLEWRRTNRTGDKCVCTSDNQPSIGEWLLDHWFHCNYAQKGHCSKLTCAL